MEKKQFLELLKKYRDGTASKDEMSFLTAYYNLFEPGSDITKIINEEEKSLLKSQMKAVITHKISLQNRKSVVRFLTPIRRIAVAVIFVLIASTILIVYEQKNANYKNYSFIQRREDIPPGSNKAILTLSSGQLITLTNAKNGILARQGKTQINKTANGKIIYNAFDVVKENDIAYNTVTTPRGGQYMVVLPDGSSVYLNSNSSLRFPTSFSGKSRTVTLTGEGYFEVAHDKQKPFLVITKDQTVEVLGTWFNINAYDDEKVIQTTLLEGKVRVSVAGKQVFLLPGEQSQARDQTNENKEIDIIRNANTEQAVAWKNGYFQFEDANIQTIMRQFSRWYDVDIIFQNTIPQRLFTGKIHRNLTMAQALDLMSYMNIHFNIIGKTITVLRLNASEGK